MKLPGVRKLILPGDRKCITPLIDGVILRKNGNIIERKIFASKYYWLDKLFTRKREKKPVGIIVTKYKYSQ